MNPCTTMKLFAPSLTFLALCLTPELPAAPAPVSPAALTDFRVVGAFPKYMTADIEFRDPTRVKWPNFFYGKPATEDGYVRLDSTKPRAAFTLRCDQMAQPNGDQSRKVLGELCQPGQPPAVTLIITGMGPLQAAAGNSKDNNGQTAELSGDLHIGATKVPVKVATSFRPHGGKGDEKKIALMLEGRFTVRASDLGLKSMAANAVIEGRFGLSAYPLQTTPGKAAK